MKLSIKIAWEEVTVSTTNSSAVINVSAVSVESASAAVATAKHSAVTTRLSVGCKDKNRTNAN